MTVAEPSAPTTSRLAFIGGGNMARSLIGGLIARGMPAHHLAVAEPQPGTREALQRDFGVDVGADPASAAGKADGVVLAVKPQVMREACAALVPALAPEALVISVAAGVDALFSLMPLVPWTVRAAVGACAIGLLVWLNLRGVRESALVLMPIFLGFLVTHGALVVIDWQHARDGGDELFDFALLAYTHWETWNRLTPRRRPGGSSPVLAAMTERFCRERGLPSALVYAYFPYALMRRMARSLSWPRYNLLRVYREHRFPQPS